MSLATNATLYRAVAKLLTSWGWPVEYAAGWETRTNGSAIRTPSAVTVHHTGGKATATSYLLNPRDRPQLKVLANMHITHDHRIKILAAGSTSHGGYTHEACYQRVVQGTAPLDRDLVPGADSLTFSINTRTVGIEVDGAGGKSEWDAWTIRAVVATSAAWQIVTGWMRDGKAPRVGAHKEHTKRKPGDPYMSMGELRTRVATVVASGKPYGPTETPPAPTVPTVPDCATEPKPTPEVPTVPTKPTPTAEFTLGVANCQSYDGDKSEKAWKARAAIIARQGWSVVCVVETTSAGRTVMLAELKRLTGHVWKTWTLGGKTVAVLWDDTIWSNPTGADGKGKRRVTKVWSPFGHGGVCVPLVHRKTGLGFDVIAHHTPPGSVATDAQKDAAIAASAKLAKAWPCVLAGDFNQSDPKLSSWIRATRRVDTLDKAGTQPIDGAFIRGAIGAGESIVVDPGALSDHKWLGVKLILGGSAL